MRTEDDENMIPSSGEEETDDKRAKREPLIDDSAFREKYKHIFFEDEDEPEITHKWKSRKKKSFAEEVNLKQLALLIIILLAVIFVIAMGVRSCIRGISGTDGDGSDTHAAATASVATVSEAERARLEREALVESVTAEYDDLAIVGASGYINMRS